MSAAIPFLPSAPALTRAHARRLRDIYRSAGWPSQDPLEIDLLAAGMLERVRSPLGHETLRVTDTGVQWLATVLARNRAALSASSWCSGSRKTWPAPAAWPGPA